MENAEGVNWELNDPDYYRKVLIRMTWDDFDGPSVLAPLGDFFCIGHSMPSSFSSIPFNVSSRPCEELTFGGTASMNCYFPMPFNKRAKIEVSMKMKDHLDCFSILIMSFIMKRLRILLIFRQLGDVICHVADGEMIFA